MIYLHKILAIVASPVAWVLLLLFVAAWRRSRAWVVLAMVVLYAASLPLVSRPLLRWAEQHQVRVAPETLPRADAIVVLSGMVRTVPGEGGAVPEWTDAVDRLFGGVDLFRAGKAPRVILTRGLLPWQSSTLPEGEVLRPVAVRLGVPERAISLTTPAENTEQEARAVRALLGPAPAHVLLVTSAFHMPRAQALFEQTGLRVTPYRVDFRVAVRDTVPMDVLPDGQALQATDMALKELLGRVYYALRRAV